MIDRISRLFRRDAAATPANAAADNTRREKPQPAAPENAQLALKIADTGRRLDAGVPAVEALAIVRDDLPADLRCRALAQVDDRAALLDLALADKVARVRLAAAERLTAGDDLERLRRDSTDKAVQRHARDLLKTLREQEQAQQETRRRIAHLLDSIAQHAARSIEPLYEAKLDSLEDNWRAVAAQATAGEQERFAEHAAIARDNVARHAAELAARDQAIDAKKQMIAACGELETVVTRLATEDLSSAVPAMTALRSVQQTRWDEAAALVPADAPLAARFREAAHTLDRWLAAAAELPRTGQDAAILFSALAEVTEPSLQTLDDWQAQLDALRARIDWPAGTAPSPLLAEIDARMRHVAKQRRAVLGDIREQVAQLRKRRNVLRHMIDEGQLRVAVRTHHWLQKRIAELPPREAEQETAALAPLAEALARLHDWYEFASVPKKTELCERIEALAAQEITAGNDGVAARAAEVRGLRERWNALCAADPDADPELRARFDRAAGIAFAPCTAWYDAQHRLQDANMAKRAALCDALEAQLAQVPADIAGWRALEKHERELRTQWKALEPVRWPEARTGQDRFHSLLGQLRAALDGERRRGADTRAALIANARTLAEESVEDAIRKAKSLQDAWKHAGWTDPRDDRALWQEFRAAIDALFARRDAARDAERTAREEQAAAAARQRAEEEARREQKRQAVIAARQAEVDAALALAAAESQALRGEPPDLGTLDTLFDALPPKSALAAPLRSRRAQLEHPPGGTALAANAEKLAALTLELEILRDIPSPPELAQARMQAKVARLNSALRHKSATPGEDPRRALEDAWLAIGPVAEGARAPLLARFRKSRD